VTRQTTHDVLQNVFRSLLNTRDYAVSLEHTSAMSPDAVAGRAGTLTGRRTSGGGDAGNAAVAPISHRIAGYSMYTEAVRRCYSPTFPISMARVCVILYVLKQSRPVYVAVKPHQEVGGRNLNRLRPLVITCMLTRQTPTTAPPLCRPTLWDKVLFLDNTVLPSCNSYVLLRMSLISLSWQSD
jgi:hypothetical protein